MYQGERFNGYSHLLGLMLATGGCALLLTKAVSGGDPAKTASALVFGLSMVALYAASTLFHSTRGRTKLFWQRMDHCAIYLLIAGSYTPFALVTLQGAWGWALLAAAWSAALFGVARELRPGTPPAPSLALYLGMGWLGVLAAVPLIERLDGGGLAWLLAGALWYSAGTVFYRNPLGWRHAHGTWHLFVLAGTASHYVTVAHFVL
ncbi:PAQR family membrane homeostasis protein TrhA [Variovorax sp. JS1663]|uniref:PAQR family membrane homeostasis protein TrhA n=1 Tax=Variovorax sp. JS1663 TaxID=1851577 RepID=UPI000B346197|nr:hemolysin III family protein [Variovorax sp. JS1663]OUL98713.1 hemolysin D [Variovorax sp. JS1663]